MVLAGRLGVLASRMGCALADRRFLVGHGAPLWIPLVVDERPSLKGKALDRLELSFDKALVVGAAPETRVSELDVIVLPPADPADFVAAWPTPKGQKPTCGARKGGLCHRGSSSSKRASYQPAMPGPTTAVGRKSWD
jgi:hypothetical protein